MHRSLCFIRVIRMHLYNVDDLLFVRFGDVKPDSRVPRSARLVLPLVVMHPVPDHCTELLPPEWIVRRGMSLGRRGQEVEGVC